MSVQGQNVEVSTDVVVRAWKDASYRRSLPEAVQQALPTAPETPDLTDRQLEQAAGAVTPGLFFGGAAVVGGVASVDNAIKNVHDDA